MYGRRESQINEEDREGRPFMVEGGINRERGEVERREKKDNNGGEVT